MAGVNNDYENYRQELEYNSAIVENEITEGNHIHTLMYDYVCGNNPLLTVDILIEFFKYYNSSLDELNPHLMEFHGVTNKEITPFNIMIWKNKIISRWFVYPERFDLLISGFRQSIIDSIISS